MPFDRRRYPANWPEISRRIRARSGGWCEGPALRSADAPRCEARQGESHPLTGARVVLTVAHLNHTPSDCRDVNLLALCQRCHLNYDRPLHIATAKIRRRARAACGDLFLGPYRIRP